MPVLRSRVSDRVVRNMALKLGGNGLANSPAYRQALGYAQFSKAFRLGRSSITNPFVFNRAFRASERVARNAQRVFHSPWFQFRLQLLFPSTRKRVVEEYRRIIKVAASLRRIQARDIVQHRQTPDVLDRRAFTELLRERISHGAGKAFSVAMVDLDDFGAINKQFGHGVGDAVLDRFASELNRLARRNGGFAGRVGGEEFQVYFSLSPDKAKQVLDEFRTTFRKETVDPYFIKSSGAVTIGEMSGWRQGISFTSGMTGTDYLRHPPSDLRPIFAAIMGGLNEGKKVSGKGTTILAHYNVR